jgi:phosphatidylglycerol:prolipoprotein diacylglycerol transferase
MCPTLFHIYGPFAINFYGLFVAIGIVCALFWAHRDPRTSKVITEDQALHLLMGSIVMGVLGARILYFLVEPVQGVSWYDIFAFWEGGGSELGSIIAITLFSGTYLRIHKIKTLPLLDIAGTYAPLVQAFARLGCFCAGCCYGAITTTPWAITYTHHDSMAPLCVPLHPVQLYTSALFFMLFYALKKWGNLFTRPGQQFCLYLAGASAIRFSTEFLSGDCGTTFPSTYQIISFILFIGALLALTLTARTNRERST